MGLSMTMVAVESSQYDKWTEWEKKMLNYVAQMIQTEIEWSVFKMNFSEPPNRVIFSKSLYQLKLMMDHNYLRLYDVAVQCIQWNLR